ncbi:hypothetical protein, partial [Bradyrhizobium sp. Mp64]|uniref:hypothetical protein n=1 Tax=Bradyrhizobium sp. Mp64 TaxID=3042158 RepID=UPI00248C5567
QNKILILRSPPKAGVSKDGREDTARQISFHMRLPCPQAGEGAHHLAIAIQPHLLGDQVAQAGVLRHG